MIVFETPKGWTGPKWVDGLRVEGAWRAHQVPIAEFKSPEHIRQLEDWMKSYAPRELFDKNGRFHEARARLGRRGRRRRGANPHANGGSPLVPLGMLDFRRFSVSISAPGSVKAEPTRVLGTFLAEVMRANLASRNFRLFGPDETASNRLADVYDVSGKVWMAGIEPVDEHLSPNGRVMEVLSGPLCPGCL